MNTIVSTTTMVCISRGECGVLYVLAAIGATAVVMLAMAGIGALMKN